MSQEQLEGMQARARGDHRATNPHKITHDRQQWFAGFDLMEANIAHVLNNAQSMLDGIEEVRRARSTMRLVPQAV